MSDQQTCQFQHMEKRINSKNDVIHFKNSSPAYKNIVTYVDLLCNLIQGTADKVLNSRFTIKNQVFIKCKDFLAKLETCCDETELKLAPGASTLRFGHTSFRDWYDSMNTLSQNFTHGSLAKIHDNNTYNEEMFTYLVGSFGNRMRIDYGTGHELNFLIFTMGLSAQVDLPEGHDPSSPISPEKLKAFVDIYGWDIHALFAHFYLRLCRKLQTKFRLEPAGSRGVYNMDDFQYLPFLFGAAQLSGQKHISTNDFYKLEQVDDFKQDYIFFEAVDFILKNKRGPFYEHSYTLCGFTSLGSWDYIFRRIRHKFSEDCLLPFPIVQHLLFGKYLLRWDTEQ